ncbi:MAG: hypothetical protein QF619_05285, partial [Candidatus Binatia bacterium]|nr:hypothetical protein [Candidatus Binatia bacterium]
SLENVLRSSRTTDLRYPHLCRKSPARLETLVSHQSLPPNFFPSRILALSFSPSSVKVSRRMGAMVDFAIPFPLSSLSMRRGP